MCKGEKKNIVGPLGGREREEGRKSEWNCVRKVEEEDEESFRRTKKRRNDEGREGEEGGEGQKGGILQGMKKKSESDFMMK